MPKGYPAAGERKSPLSGPPASAKTGTRTRSERVLRLKEELNLILQLVVHSRESLESELSSEFAQKKLSIDDKFLKKLKELTTCYSSLTDARVRLDKSERELEREMTPEEEKEAVRLFCASLLNPERSEFISQIVADYRRDHPRGQSNAGHTVSAG